LTPSTSGGRDLASLRRDLEEIDRAIVLLLAARVEAARLTIAYRTERGGAVTLLPQEERVLDRARVWAADVGLAPSVVDTVFRSLIIEGKSPFRARVPDTPPEPVSSEIVVARRTRAKVRSPTALAPS